MATILDFSSQRGPQGTHYLSMSKVLKMKTTENSRLVPAIGHGGCCGHLLNCGRQGWRAFDREGRLVNYFKTQSEAMAPLLALTGARAD
jgi:hypothetical protein